MTATRHDKRSEEWKSRPAYVRMLFLGSGWVNINRSQHQLAEKFLVSSGVFCGVAGLLGMFGLIVDHEHVVAFLGCSAGLLLCGWLTSLSIRLGDHYAVWPWVEPKQ